jgi:hypothetical protein
MCVCENLEWRILPLCNEKLITEAEAEMNRIGVLAQARKSLGEWTIGQENQRRGKKYNFADACLQGTLEIKKGRFEVSNTEILEDGLMICQ